MFVYQNCMLMTSALDPLNFHFDYSLLVSTIVIIIIIITLQKQYKLLSKSRTTEIKTKLHNNNQRK